MCEQKTPHKNNNKKHNQTETAFSQVHSTKTELKPNMILLELKN